MQTTLLRTSLSLILILMLTNAASARPFSNTKVWNGTYLMVDTLAQYDDWVSQYPSAASPCRFTFYRDGTVLVEDLGAGGSMVGTYSRINSGTIHVQLQLQPGGYFNSVTYKLYRSQGAWWGEIYFDSYLYGHFRGNF